MSAILMTGPETSFIASSVASRGEHPLFNVVLVSFIPAELACDAHSNDCCPLS